MVLIDYAKPKTCGECAFVGHYEAGVYARNPHCCCELQWLLHEDDHKVEPNSMDEECPLKEVVGMEVRGGRMKTRENELQEPIISIWKNSPISPFLFGTVQCPICEEALSSVRRTTDDESMIESALEIPNYCPNCGARLKEINSK